MSIINTLGAMGLRGLSLWGIATASDDNNDSTRSRLRVIGKGMSEPVSRTDNRALRVEDEEGRKN